MKSVVSSASATSPPAFAEAEGVVKAVLDGLAAHAAILDESGTILCVNRSWRQFAENHHFDTPRYGVGSNYLAVCDRAGMPDAQAAAAGIRQVMAGQAESFSLEYPFHSAKERRWFLLQVTRFVWRESSYLLVVHQDVTEIKRAQSEVRGSARRLEAVLDNRVERKSAEAHLLEQERLNAALAKERELRDLQNRFLSTLSHELRTPLGAIQLANSMLRSYADRLSEQEKRESYETIDTQVAHLAEMINDVMTITRADFTGMEFEPETLDLETYLRDIIEEIQLAYRMQCCIDFTGTNRRIEASVDRKLLRRAITNLVINAIKYSPPESPIDITLTIEGGDALIRVSDRGIGIPEDDLKRLFEPFHRASNVGQIQGTGLGMAIVKQAVERHSGTISAISRVGEGTTFSVRLPLMRRD